MGLRLKPARQSGRFISAAARYWTGVYPCVNREIHHYRGRARSIANPDLRLVALANLHAERPNLEGAAAFASFAPRRYRPQVIRAQVAFQAAYDYADTLAEQPNPHSIENAHQLHLSLLDAIQPNGGHRDYYACHSDDDDGGYLMTLVETARAALVDLPQYQAVSEPIRRSVERIVSYQSLNGSPDQLSCWASAETSADMNLDWWETAAACGSSMAVFALMAQAVRPILQPKEIAGIENTYFPWVGALHTLLDSLVDRAEDVTAGRQSLIDYYGSAQAAIERLTVLVLQARRRAETLPLAHGHTLILAAMMNSYLSSLPAVDAGGRLAQAMGGLARPTRAVFWLRHLVARTRAKTAAIHFTL